MKIKTAFILCAGFGKRLNPLTLKTPKPLLEIDNSTLLENTINLIKKLNIQKIKLNTFHLKNKIQSFMEKKNFNIDIEIIDDGDQILNTGGGVYNMMKSCPEIENHFIVFNPDTIWEPNYVKIIDEMIKFYFLNSNSNTLLVVDKKLSFDRNLKGDFSFQNNRLIRNYKNDYIFTGCQIINRKTIYDGFLKQSELCFPISSMWSIAMKGKNLLGFESKNNFKHITNFKVYQKLLDL
jgi:N-acetyl-alpha-D-muramate 1-phosphate uridylyltransferase